MGTIATGIGLISGIDTATLIDNLIALEARGKLGLQARLVSLQAQKTALLDINSRLLNFKNIARSFRLDSIFNSALASSSNSVILTAIASAKSLPGTFTFIVKQLVSTSQKLSAGFVDTDTAPLGLTSLSFEFSRGALSTDTDLENLNGGAGVARGKIVIIDSVGTTTVDLTDATSLNEVLDRINNSGANVTAAVEGDHLVVTENSAGSLDIANAIGYTMATAWSYATTWPTFALPPAKRLPRPSTSTSVGSTLRSTMTLSWLTSTTAPASRSATTIRTPSSSSSLATSLNTRSI